MLNLMPLPQNLPGKVILQSDVTGSRIRLDFVHGIFCMHAHVKVINRAFRNLYFSRTSGPTLFDGIISRNSIFTDSF